MTTIALGDTLDISCVSALRDWLLVALEENRTLRLNVGDLERVDTAGLQLLAAALIDARSRGVAVTLVGTSEVLESGMRLLGLEDLLAATERVAVDQ